MVLDDDSIDRILKHTGSEHVPPTLDKSELCNDILAAWDFYQGYGREQSKGERTKQRKYATEIAQMAGKFSHLLDDPRPEAYQVRKLIGMRFGEPDGDPSFDALKRGVTKLKAFADSIARRCGGQASLREVLTVLPSFQLIGHDLAAVFEKHFRRPANRRRDQDGLPDGAFVRFVTAATAELGEPFTAETVSKAMSVVRVLEKGQAED
jgi:hypothetical protein